MRIIISPAKKMKVDTDSFPIYALPIFLSKTEELLAQMREMPFSELKKLWNCNEEIAILNFERLQSMDLYQGLTPAILSYEGIQYRYMAPGVFTREEFRYVEEHLRILSGFYGLLRPFDGVTPYRLEMGAKLKTAGKKDLYDFWNDQLAQYLLCEGEGIVNLASKEYSRCIMEFLPAGSPYINCIFAERKAGKLIEKGTLCKMVRGEMVRWMAREQVKDWTSLKEFRELGYRFAKEESNKENYVFLKESIC